MQERDWAHLARAFQQFGKIPEGREYPTNAITLWHHLVEGVLRVADALTEPPEK